MKHIIETKEKTPIAKLDKVLVIAGANYQPTTKKLDVIIHRAVDTGEGILYGAESWSGATRLQITDIESDDKALAGFLDLIKKAESALSKQPENNGVISKNDL